jgi:acetyl-CoA carboxylase biotin carboxyl carrier protein
VPDRTRSKSDRVSGDDARTAAARAADHAAIGRLGDELLPALIAKLGATGLGELEVREGNWRVRLRRPATASGSRDRRAGDRAASERSTEKGPERPPRAHHHHPEPAPSVRNDSRSVATSPAVGVYQPRKDVTAGARVRAGDRLGAVDMLGIAQEVVSPVDGIVGASLVEAGDAVEYGQELIVIEFTPVPSSTNGTGA